MPAGSACDRLGTPEASPPGRSTLRSEMTLPVNRTPRVVDANCSFSRSCFPSRKALLLTPPGDAGLAHLAGKARRFSLLPPGSEATIAPNIPPASMRWGLTGDTIPAPVWGMNPVRPDPASYANPADLRHSPGDARAGTDRPRQTGHQHAIYREWGLRCRVVPHADSLVV